MYGFQFAKNKDQLATKIVRELQKIAFCPPNIDEVKVSHKLTALQTLIKLMDDPNFNIEATISADNKRDGDDGDDYADDEDVP